MNIGK